MTWTRPTARSGSRRCAWAAVREWRCSWSDWANSRRLAAVDDERVAGHERRRRRGEERNRALQVVRAAESSQGDLHHELLAEVIEEHLRHVRGEPARRNRVHTDAAPGPLAREVTGECDHAALARVIGDRVHLAGGRATEAGHRGDVHDRAAAPAEHHPACGLREEENAGEVDVDDLLPALERGLLRRCAPRGPGVVDQY